MTTDFPVWERPYFHASRSLSQSLDAALKVSEVRTEDIDLFDFYSYVTSQLPILVYIVLTLMPDAFPSCPSSQLITSVSPFTAPSPSPSSGA